MRRSHLADKRRWCRRPWQREEGNNIQIYILEIRLIPHCLRGASSLVLLNCDLSATWYLSRGRSATSNCTRTQPVRSLASSLAIEEFSSWQVPSAAPSQYLAQDLCSDPDSRLPTLDSRLPILEIRSRFHSRLPTRSPPVCTHTGPGPAVSSIGTVARRLHGLPQRRGSPLATSAEGPTSVRMPAAPGGRESLGLGVGTQLSGLPLALKVGLPPPPALGEYVCTPGHTPPVCAAHWRRPVPDGAGCCRTKSWFLLKGARRGGRKGLSRDRHFAGE